MPYKVNGKNLALTRLLVRGKMADKRMKYLHVGPKGTTVITPHSLARVSLPRQDANVVVAEIISQAKLDSMPRIAPEDTASVVLPQGEPAVTGHEFLVPQMDKCFPTPEYTKSVFTCNADHLRKLLTVACEVSKDSDKAIRLRLCPDLQSLRIDNYRHPGDQEFVAVLKGIDYDGGYFPGEMPSNAPAKPEKKPVQRGIPLKIANGRRFRGERE